MAKGCVGSAIVQKSLSWWAVRAGVWLLLTTSHGQFCQGRSGEW